MHIIILILIITSSSGFASNDDFCLKKVELKISNMHPRISFESSEKNRKEKIRLFLVTNCKKNAKVIKPKSKEEAIKYLDIMLPVDIKAGLISVDYIHSVYLISPYGVSTMTDLYHFVSKEWGFKRKKNICYPSGKKNKEDKECFDILVEELIRQYKNPVKYKL